MAADNHFCNEEMPTLRPFSFFLYPTSLEQIPHFEEAMNLNAIYHLEDSRSLLSGDLIG